ncbi:non-ribosomal peptide synthetase [Paenibacillus sp. OK003]|uniref:non-ribosomal peptide synthetase n=1 Tax=Paenibacillus sp. OK003 TaxID=1884380 RepID=UPI0008ACF07E|nr:non-ribosomal peptide synthetase [Paenibacillus sp. OK003]SEL32538.1 amino acid adenylation domain-containing protein [Paenibacillus sp. OK003]
MGIQAYDLVAAYNDTSKIFKNFKLDQLLKNSSERFGDKIAIMDRDQEITYQELYYRVSKLAAEITCENQPVGIIARRSIQTVIQIFAVLQSGNYYIPLDPNYPQERTDYIVAKTNARLLLDGNQLTWLHQEEVDVPFLSKIQSDDQIAYIIFTSGSTGLPKGVVETHYQVMNTLRDLKERLSLNENDRFLCLASFNFDLSVFDIFGAALVGGALYITEDQRDFVAIKNIIEEQNITIWNSVPSVLDYFLKEIELSDPARNNLRVCLMSGDYVSIELSKKVLSTFPNSKTYSLGGATECSIWSILHLITQENLGTYPYIPYGNPMNNQRIYILNEELGLAKPDMVGQIGIAGAGVALGYIGDESKTNETFIEHEQLGYLYLTGDLGRFDKDGHIKFTGRMDSRVKINGYRVSLSEISSVFHQHFGLENRMFLLGEQEGTQKLVLAYQSNIALDSSKIRKELLQHLAIYEIPHMQICFSEFPLTTNGKIDMKALKKSVEDRISEQNQNRQTEESNTDVSPFRQMLAEVLKIKNLSSEDSLFALGADSLQLVKIKTWIEENMDVEIELLDIYDCDQVTILEAFIETSQKSNE